MKKKFKDLVFSGVQPSGNLHLGNYLGAIRNFVELQKKMDCIYSIVDLHAITVFQDPKKLEDNILETVSSFIACGLDYKKSIIFNQSSVSAHAELAWIFNCVSRLGWLNRMTQFKEKAGSNKENASVGLYVYPNLMAADILLYKANYVPVGDDQKQHLELCRDIANKFNNDFNNLNFFPLPEPLILKTFSRVMSLRNGKKKMSKSEESDYSRINLQDSEDEIESSLDSEVKRLRSFSTKQWSQLLRGKTFHHEGTNTITAVVYRGQKYGYIVEYEDQDDKYDEYFQKVILDLAKNEDWNTDALKTVARDKKFSGQVSN